MDASLVQYIKEWKNNSVAFSDLLKYSLRTAQDRSLFDMTTIYLWVLLIMEAGISIPKLKQGKRVFPL